MTNHFSRPNTPGAARGIAPLIIAAMAAGGLRAGIGAIQGNQKKQRNKGYINAAHRTAKQRLDTDQGEARQGIAESLNARGLAQQGTVNASPIHTAMVGEKMTASGSPVTIGQQQVSNANEEMGLEQQDLTQQKDRALKENKAEYMNALLQSGVSGIQTGIDVYSAGKAMQAGKGGAGGAGGAAPLASRSKIHDTMLSSMSYDGVNPIDPLGSSTSAWSTNVLAQPGQANASFNVG